MILVISCSSNQRVSRFPSSKIEDREYLKKVKNDLNIILVKTDEINPDRKGGVAEIIDKIEHSEQITIIEDAFDRGIFRVDILDELIKIDSPLKLQLFNKYIDIIYDNNDEMIIRVVSFLNHNLFDQELFEDFINALENGHKQAVRSAHLRLFDKIEALNEYQFNHRKDVLKQYIKNYLADYDQELLEAIDDQLFNINYRYQINFLGYIYEIGSSELLNEYKYLVKQINDPIDAELLRNFLVLQYEKNEKIDKEVIQNYLKLNRSQRLFISNIFDPFIYGIGSDAPVKESIEQINLSSLLDLLTKNTPSSVNGPDHIISQYIYTNIQNNRMLNNELLGLIKYLGNDESNKLHKKLSHALIKYATDFELSNEISYGFNNFIEQGSTNKNFTLYQSILLSGLPLENIDNYGAIERFYKEKLEQLKSQIPNSSKDSFSKKYDQFLKSIVEIFKVDEPIEDREKRIELILSTIDNMNVPYKTSAYHQIIDTIAKTPYKTLKRGLLKDSKNYEIIAEDILFYDLIKIKNYVNIGMSFDKFHSLMSSYKSLLRLGNYTQAMEIERRLAEGFIGRDVQGDYRAYADLVISHYTSIDISRATAIYEAPELFYAQIIDNSQTDQSDELRFRPEFYRRYTEYPENKQELVRKMLRSGVTLETSFSIVDSLEDSKVLDEFISEFESFVKELSIIQRLSKNKTITPSKIRFEALNYKSKLSDNLKDIINYNYNYAQALSSSLEGFNKNKRRFHSFSGRLKRPSYSIKDCRSVLRYINSLF